MSTISSGTTSTTTLVHSGDTTGSLVFKTNDTGSGGTTAMTIDTSQNVGIGTTNPAGIRLYVYGTGAQYIRAESSTYSNWQQIFSANGSVGTEFSASQPYRWVDTSAGERMRIDSSGKLLVGTTTVYGTATTNIGFVGNVGSGLSINSTTNTNGATYEVFYTTGTLIGSISNNNNTGIAYNTTSDYRLKENVAPMTGALAKVSQLKPVTYTWKSNNSDGQGFIAHELQEVVPDCVTGEKDAVDADGNPQYQCVDTSFLVATLTAAIQELKSLVDTQATEIAELKAKVGA